MVGEGHSETQGDVDEARKDQLQACLDQLRQECHQVHRLNLAFPLAETPRPGVAWTTALEVGCGVFGVVALICLETVLKAERR